MKCPYCGAEVNTSLMKCEYCDSKIEYSNPQMEYRSKNTTRKSQSSIKPVITVFVIVFVVITVMAMFVIPLSGAMIAYKSLNDFGSVQVEYQPASSEEVLVDRLPKNAVDLVGEVVSCTTAGNATISYGDKNYRDIKILDTELIEWLVEVGASINGVGIMFSTDEDRNISEISLLSSAFYIMYQEGDTYVAFREDHVIAFTSEMELEVDKCYEGYFNYPNMNLHSGTTTDCGSMHLFDTVCAEKEITTELAVRRTNKEVTVYKLRVGSDWYYCSKNTYDKINIGDDLSEFTFANLGYRYVY